MWGGPLIVMADVLQAGPRIPRAIPSYRARGISIALHSTMPSLKWFFKAGPITIVEIGCGAGNSVFPLLESNKNPDLRLCAYDYSSQAVKVVQVHTPNFVRRFSHRAQY